MITIATLIGHLIPLLSFVWLPPPRSASSSGAYSAPPGPARQLGLVIMDGNPADAE